MKPYRRIASLGSVLTILSCTHTVVTPAPATVARPTTAATPAPGGGGRAGGPARVALSRDSLAVLRATYVAQVMAKIAGRENQPAEQVFTNVQVLKGITAGALVEKMDKEYSVAMSWNCTNCHRLAPQGNFASDTSVDKKRARFMQQMVNDINHSELPKLYPANTPSISCGTCHRGYNTPLAPQYLIPERGKPGGPPAPAPRPGR